MSTLKIKIIVGSTRANRFSDKPAQWIFDLASQRADLDVELLDLRDYPLPFFEEALPPGLAKDSYTNPQVVKWRDKVRTPTASSSARPVQPRLSGGAQERARLVYAAWARKAVSFVSWAASAARVGRAAPAGRHRLDMWRRAGRSTSQSLVHQGGQRDGDRAEQPAATVSSTT